MSTTEHTHSDRHGNQVIVDFDEAGNVTRRRSIPTTGWRCLRWRVNGGASWDLQLAHDEFWSYLGQPIDLDKIHQNFSHLISEVRIDHGGLVEFIREDGEAIAKDAQVRAE